MENGINFELPMRVGCSVHWTEFLTLEVTRNFWSLTFMIRDGEEEFQRGQLRVVMTGFVLLLPTPGRVIPL